MDGENPHPDPLTASALRSLADIAEPQPISFMPQTWGWLLLAIIALLILSAIAFRRLRRYRADAYRRAAIAELDGIGQEIGDPETRLHAIQSLSELLKRTALVAWPRENVASLSGPAWVRFLETHDDGLGSGLAHTLEDFEYCGSNGIGILPATIGEDLVTDARKWIERHHVSA